jgi:hypothetical protein
VDKYSSFSPEEAYVTVQSYFAPCEMDIMNKEVHGKENRSYSYARRRLLVCFKRKGTGNPQDFCIDGLDSNNSKFLFCYIYCLYHGIPLQGFSLCENRHQLTSLYAPRSKSITRYKATVPRALCSYTGKV